MRFWIIPAVIKIENNQIESNEQHIYYFTQDKPSLTKPCAGSLLKFPLIMWRTSQFPVEKVNLYEACVLTLIF